MTRVEENKETDVNHVIECINECIREIENKRGL